MVSQVTPPHVVPRDLYILDPVIPNEGHPLVEHHGLIMVLIPSTQIDSRQLAADLIGLGVGSSSEVLLLGRPEKWASFRENDFYRLAIFLRLTGLKVTSKLLLNKESWVEWIEYYREPSDIVVCHAEYRGETLRQQITSELNLTVYVLSGLYPTPTSRWKQILRRGSFELLLLGIIAATFWLQMQIADHSDGPLTNFLVISAVVLQVGALLVWSLFVK